MTLRRRRHSRSSAPHNAAGVRATDGVRQQREGPASPPRGSRPAIGLLAAAWLCCAAGPARSGWIDDYLAARDICGPRFPGLHAMLTAGGPGVLLGRPVEAWTQGDLDALPTAFRTCQRTAAALGAQVYPGEATDDIVAAVRRSWLERDQRRAREEAARRLAEDEARRAASLADEEQARTGERKRVADLERTKELEQQRQTTARAEAEAAEAAARRDVDEARRKAAAAQAAARRAVAEAEAARRAADAEAGAPPKTVDGAGGVPERKEARPHNEAPAERDRGPGAGAKPSRLHIGQSARVTVDTPACPDLTDLRRVVELMIVEHDVRAASKYARQYGCEGLEEGTRGQTESFTLMGDATCLRQKGEPSCLWLPSPYVAQAR